MAKKSRRAGRRVKDKWKSKSWYRIVAPKIFDESVIGETVASEPESLLGRVTEISLQDLAGDFSRTHIKAKFKITGIRGGECKTRFIGHEMTTDYVRRLTRRRRSKIEAVFTVRTKEGFKIKVKPLSITNKRINSSIKRSLRKKQREVVKEMANDSRLGEFAEKILFGELAKKIANECKTVYPLKQVEIWKSEVVSVPEQEELDVKIITEEEMEEEEEKEEGEEETEEAEEEEEEEPEMPSKPEVVEQFQDIEGVGPTIAEKLYDGGFHTFQQLKDASQDDLTDVKGIGESVSETIYESLHS
ncbi:MAG: 30S ribosomal protein S3ae [Candidatus Thermoplasmatota archaeon]|nr:30S ribosomal protein S3ae [Candidatus Thermoplasmatota archaeon]